MIGIRTDKTTVTTGKIIDVRNLDARPIDLSIVCLLIVVLLVVSALGVIYSSYKSRQLFSESQKLNRESIQLGEEWGRLLLEQSTWASPDRINELAKEKLQMIVPETSAIIVIQQ